MPPSRAVGRTAQGLPIVAIVGRPNVGKSTLFNRIIGERAAIVEDRARTTRDRMYGEAEWNGRRFVIVDTGGLEKRPGDPIEARVQEQARLAISEADLIMFVVDAATGETPGDQEAAELLRSSKVPVLVAVNKADNEKRELEGAEFHRLGWDDTFAVSALHGRGTGDLLDALVWALPPETADELERKRREADEEDWIREFPDIPWPGLAHDLAADGAGYVRAVTPLGDAASVDDGADGLDEDADDTDDADDADGGAPAAAHAGANAAAHAGAHAAAPGLEVITDAEAERIAAAWDEQVAADRRRAAEPVAVAIVGRPNVGKSSLLNALLGEERMIVSDVPGTTRDAIDTPIEWNDEPLTLIDTAGLRRRGKAAGGPPAERFSSLRALRALGRCDVAILVLDAVEGLTHQDANVAGYVVEEGKGLVIAINKWDLVEKDEHTFDEYTANVRREAHFLDFAPIVAISAKTGQRVGRVLDAAQEIAGERRRRVATAELNRLLAEATYRQPPPSPRGKRLKFFYATQAATAPPTFVLFVNDTEEIHFSYKRYLENQIRERFGFHGTPVRLVFRQRVRVQLERRRPKGAAASGRRQAAGRGGPSGRTTGPARPTGGRPGSRRGGTSGGGPKRSR